MTDVLVQTTERWNVFLAGRKIKMNEMRTRSCTCRSSRAHVVTTLPVCKLSLQQINKSTLAAASFDYRSANSNCKWIDSSYWKLAGVCQAKRPAGPCKHVAVDRVCCATGDAAAKAMRTSRQTSHRVAGKSMSCQLMMDTSKKVQLLANTAIDSSKRSGRIRQLIGCSTPLFCFCVRDVWTAH